jgi:hypothetical protein
MDAGDSGPTFFTSNEDAFYYTAEQMTLNGWWGNTSGGGSAPSGKTSVAQNYQVAAAQLNMWADAGVNNSFHVNPDDNPLLPGVMLPEVYITDWSQLSASAEVSYNSFWAGQNANQGGLTRAQEFGKYGRISWGYNIMAGASYGPAGGIVETGTVITDKGWARDYIAYYCAPGFSPPNGSNTFFYIRASDDNNPPVFSDWSGLAKGVSGSFLWIAGGAGMGSNYSVWSLGVSIAPAAFNFMKETKLTGGLVVGNTTWIGAPYRMPAGEGMTRFYINEKMYYGGP